MGPRILFATLIALALLLAPAFSRVGELPAASPDNHHAQMVQDGHCQTEEPLAGEHGKAPKKSCCLSACVGVAVISANGLQAVSLAPAPATSGVRSLHLSYLGEIATPPPKDRQRS